MYNKCYISKNIQYPTIASNIGLYPINVYYLNNQPNTGIPNKIIADIKQFAIQYENNNKDKCVITFGEPSNYENEKIYNLSIQNQ